MKYLIFLIIFIFTYFSSSLQTSNSFQTNRNWIIWWDLLKFNTFEYDYILNLKQIKTYNFSNYNNQKEYTNFKNYDIKLKNLIRKSYLKYKDYEMRAIVLNYSNFIYNMDMYFYFLNEKEKYPNDIEINNSLINHKKEAFIYFKKFKNLMLKKITKK